MFTRTDVEHAEGDLESKVVTAVVEAITKYMTISPGLSRDIARHIVEDEDLLKQVIANLSPEILAEALARNLMHMMSTGAGTAPNNPGYAMYKHISKQAMELAAEKFATKMYEDVQGA